MSGLSNNPEGAHTSVGGTRGRRYRARKSESSLMEQTDRLPPILDPRCMQRHQLIASLRHGYLPADTLLPDRDNYGPFIWVQQVVKEVPADTALQSALGALSMAVQAKQSLNDSSDLLQDAATAYVQAMQRMQSFVSEPLNIDCDDGIAGFLALTTFETVTGRTDLGRGWLVHMKGMSDFVKAQGPAAFRDGVGHQYFQAFRHFEATYVLLTRSSSFAGRGGWVTTPWSTQLKGPLQQLFDLIFELGDTLKTLDEAAGSVQGPSVSCLTDLYEDFLDLERRLRQWYLEMTHEYPGSHHAPRLSTLDLGNCDESVRTTFPTFNHFQDVPTAYLYVYHWLTNLFISESISGICDLLPKTNSGGLAALNNVEQIKVNRGQESATLARNIASSIEYLIMPDMRWTGALYAALPLQIIRRYYQDHGARELRWVEAVQAKQRARGILHGQVWARSQTFPPSTISVTSDADFGRVGLRRIR